MRIKKKDANTPRKFLKSTAFCCLEFSLNNLIYIEVIEYVSISFELHEPHLNFNTDLVYMGNFKTSAATAKLLWL